MKKGIIFSVDATYGMIAVFFILSMLTFYYSGATNTTTFAEKTGSETNDGAIIGFYTNMDGADLGLSDTTLGKEFFECARHKIFALEVGDSQAQSGFTGEKNYCRGIEWKEE